MDKKPTISVAVPTHDMHDKVFFFRRLLDSLWTQTFQDFEIVVTDNSDDDVIEKMCEYYKTGIKYFKNPTKGMAQNSNRAIQESTGDIVKILYMDDFLYNDKVLTNIFEKLDHGWLVCGTNNNSHPKWTDDIETGNNKLGSPSALAFENKDPLLFDEELTWLLDCDLYKRLHARYGLPKILVGECVGIGIGPHQMTYLISDERKLQEQDYLATKYE